MRHKEFVNLLKTMGICTMVTTTAVAFAFNMECLAWICLLAWVLKAFLFIVCIDRPKDWYERHD